ncbi:hypothetical protein TRV_00036 [Trichophyton verrucosum HKI 0517]|uniref:Uncharacterized protein n=1 Tax=Trichophyton verrucosum (strain HKI 0517) TaxID=663202 RepID=D4CYZ9_TRIVH|nr:uncharacterized protein TRV_00036 [Trichophyton verrucosum HKI 0517]EFE45163.1 hypothetical protein TRV_00036 [Trichophyton verrucosum HKI 0517]
MKTMKMKTFNDVDDDKEEEEEEEEEEAKKCSEVKEEGGRPVTRAMRGCTYV